MMSFRIKKVAVLGSGVMGSGIACHLANVGLQVLLLDLKSEGANPNSVADNALNAALKSKPAPLYSKSFISRIKTGNFEDHLHMISEVDWIIEAVVERVDIKQQLFARVEQYRKSGVIVTSNTSGIPIRVLADGRSSDFKRHFCGTHFFNPARYMPLLEIIPHTDTAQELIDLFMRYGDIILGKRTVLCKDTPAFIANRIGFYSGNKITELTDKYHLSVVEVDKLTGDLIGWPSTGSFRLLDLVGLDTSVKVTMGVIQSCPDDEYVKKLKNQAKPKHTEFLLENGWLGNKSGQGYYKKTNEKGPDGKSIILALDLDTLEYKPVEKPNVAAIAHAKKIELMDKRLQALVDYDDKGGHFLRDYFAGLLAYASNRVPEISDKLYSIDDAMKAGYAWSYGPFEYWDLIGFEKGLGMIKEAGEQPAPWVLSMQSKGHSAFYRVENGQRLCYNPITQNYEPIDNMLGLVHLDNHRSRPPVYKNSECTLHDIGDGVLCFEFTSKANTIGEGTGMGVMEAMRIAEDQGWKGIVIGNNAKNFSVGANLMVVGMEAMQKNFAKLEQIVHGFQQINMAMRYASIPIVTATQGYVFGGGCEMLMHTDAAVCAAESYIGLVEVGVGLLPGGGGTKEFSLRASESFFEGDVQIPTIIDKLRTIATGAVSTSAEEAFNLGYLSKNRDSVCIGTHRVLTEAKNKVLQLANRYVAPVPKEVTVLGRGALAALYTAINEFFLGEYMSEHDVLIARKIAYVLCGGDISASQTVSEQYLLDLEREAFLELLGTQKTLDRIQYMLMNNRPLRN